VGTVEARGLLIDGIDNHETSAGSTRRFDDHHQSLRQQLGTDPLTLQTGIER